MSHVTLVRGPSVTQIHKIDTDIGVIGAPPLGLAYLAGSLDAAGHRVTAIDAVGEAIDAATPVPGMPLCMHGLTIEQVVARIPADTDCIGISCMFSTEWIVHREMIVRICEAFPDTPVVLGGEQITAEYEYAYECCPAVAACVLGEGDEAIVDIANALDEGRPLSELAGLALYDAATGEITKTPERRRQRSLDDIAWPLWSALPTEPYLATGMGHGITNAGRVMPMLASRGCPYRCTFCSNPGMWGKLWNSRSPEDVVAEMKHYIKEYGATHITFWDLTMIVKRDWMYQFTRLLIEEDLPVEWSMPSGTRCEAMDQELAHLILKSKCRKISFAPESGSERDLERVQKKVKLDSIVEAIRVSSKAGLVTKAHIIMGFPGSTVWDILATYRLMLRMSWAGLNDCPVYLFHPYPGSHLHKVIRESGKIPGNGPEYDRFMALSLYNNYSNITSWNENISPRALRMYAITGMSLHYATQFLFRPWRPFQSLIRVTRSKPITMLERLPAVTLRRIGYMIQGLFRSKPQETGPSSVVQAVETGKAAE